MALTKEASRRQDRDPVLEPPLLPFRSRSPRSRIIAWIRTTRRTRAGVALFERGQTRTSRTVHQTKARPLRVSVWQSARERYCDTSATQEKLTNNPSVQMPTISGTRPSARRPILERTHLLPQLRGLGAPFQPCRNSQKIKMILQQTAVPPRSGQRYNPHHLLFQSVPLPSTLVERPFPNYENHSKQAQSPGKTRLVLRRCLLLPKLLQTLGSRGPSKIPRLLAR